MKEQQVIDFFLENGVSNLKGKMIGLTGDLGAGKTFFTKKFLNSIHKKFEDQVSSPTFSYCNIYKTALLEVHHYDLYRIEDENYLYEIGVYDSLSNPDVLCIFEWVDMFPDLEKKCDNLLLINSNPDGIREYKLS